MTEKEINEAYKPIRGKLYKDMTENEIKLYQELSCREMINAILCYDGISGLYTDNGYNEYLLKYLDKLGEKRLMELIYEQQGSFAAAKVYRNVYTDNEGISYNSIEWGDEGLLKNIKNPPKSLHI